MVGVYGHPGEVPFLFASLQELTRLVATAGGTVARELTCELRRAHPGTFIGKGKIEQIHQLLQEESFGLVVFNDEITPTQNRNLEKIWGVRVIDRTGLILDIFARRARTQEGKLQVELAQLKYLLPRLVGQGVALSRLGGGIGTRGPGETKLEVDRRRAREKIERLQLELKKVRAHRQLHRQKRSRTPIPLVSMVGYTNAGKSTLMNALTKAGVLVEDKLFATLDPTVRTLKLPSGREVLLADTVGFVDKLPHELVEAFKATFEEMASAQLLLHVIDGSHPCADQQVATVEGVLQDLEMAAKPVLRVINKMDQGAVRLTSRRHDLMISALQKEGLKPLLVAIETQLSGPLKYVKLLVPHQLGAQISSLYRTARVLKREDRASGVYLEVEMDEKNYNTLKKYRFPKHA